MDALPDNELKTRLLAKWAYKNTRYVNKNGWCYQEESPNAKHFTLMMSSIKIWMRELIKGDATISVPPDKLVS